MLSNWLVKVPQFCPKTFNSLRFVTLQSVIWLSILAGIPLLSLLRVVEHARNRFCLFIIIVWNLKLVFSEKDYNILHLALYPPMVQMAGKSKYWCYWFIYTVHNINVDTSNNRFIIKNIIFIYLNNILQINNYRHTYYLDFIQYYCEVIN